MNRLEEKARKEGFMKKMRKMIAVVLAVTVALTMGIASTSMVFAAEGAPADTSISVTGLENGDKVTVITYSYDYDDYTFYIEADVQAIQTHNVNDAITGLWGVSNVTANDGKVTVR